MQEMWYDCERKPRKEYLQLQALQEYHTVFRSTHSICMQAPISRDSNHVYWDKIHCLEVKILMKKYVYSLN